MVVATPPLTRRSSWVLIGLGLRLHPPCTQAWPRPKFGSSALWPRPSPAPPCFCQVGSECRPRPVFRGLGSGSDLPQLLQCFSTIRHSVLIMQNELQLIQSKKLGGDVPSGAEEEEGWKERRTKGNGKKFGKPNWWRRRRRLGGKWSNSECNWGPKWHRKNALCLHQSSWCVSFKC